MEPIFFDSIVIEPPKDKIYSRLGYAKGKTELTPPQREKIEKYIQEALTFIGLKGVGAILSIEEINLLGVKLLKGIVFQSRSLAKALTGCKEVLLMGATAGSKIIEVIGQNSLGYDITSSVVFDATASEMVDTALDWIMNYFNRQLLRESKHFSPRRFSAGYGDFLLDNQKIICDILRIERIGVTLTKEYILIPEKSVTAIVGIMQCDRK